VKLTPNQEKFCQLVANGSNYSSAYRESYSRSVKWKDKTVHECASRLCSKVGARIDDIKKELEKQNLWTKVKSVKILATIAEQAEKESDKIAAVKELNSMHGFNAPNKHDISNSDGSLKPLVIQVVGVKKDAADRSS